MGGLEQQRTGPAERRRIPRRDVPDVGEVSHTRPEPGGSESITEPLDLRVVVPRTCPRPRVRDEDLEAVGAPRAGFFDRPCDARLPAPDMGAEDHA